MRVKCFLCKVMSVAFIFASLSPAIAGDWHVDTKNKYQVGKSFHEFPLATYKSDKLEKSEYVEGYIRVPKIFPKDILFNSKTPKSRDEFKKQASKISEHIAQKYKTNAMAKEYQDFCYNLNKEGNIGLVQNGITSDECMGILSAETSRMIFNFRFIHNLEASYEQAVTGFYNIDQDKFVSMNDIENHVAPIKVKVEWDDSGTYSTGSTSFLPTLVDVNFGSRMAKDLKAYRFYTGKIYCATQKTAKDNSEFIAENCKNAKSIQIASASIHTSLGAFLQIRKKFDAIAIEFFTPNLRSYIIYAPMKDVYDQLFAAN